MAVRQEARLLSIRCKFDLIHAKGFPYAYLIILGEDADRNYMRVAKEVAKEEKTKKEKDDKKPAKRTRPGGYQGFQYQAPLMQMPMQMTPITSMYQPQQFQSFSQGQSSQLTQRIPKSHLRCLNCGEFGHFAKECHKQINTQT